ncbi:hypothetical protein H6P81_004496 [Aristolochia fimbriata]|uniref:Uncharacterized protein n=1 Tax=Aristolochia fimbriata TaxID=158543 RepID=A0AAV7FG76_ARIFI|nr:hypothetical protein H6P81_004496 [Aristolochia fimbriata]
MINLSAASNEAQINANGNCFAKGKLFHDSAKRCSKQVSLFRHNIKISQRMLIAIGLPDEALDYLLCKKSFKAALQSSLSTWLTSTALESFSANTVTLPISQLVFLRTHRNDLFKDGMLVTGRPEDTWKSIFEGSATNPNIMPEFNCIAQGPERPVSRASRKSDEGYVGGLEIF